jgi:hypothetical protein
MSNGKQSMKVLRKKPNDLSLVHSLAWIIGSSLIISGSAHWGMKHFFKQKLEAQGESPAVIQTLVQTGPQREALKTEYLAELLEISADNPPLVSTFNLKEAAKVLRASPLIAEAQVKLLKPSTLYIDYTVRQPIAWLGDYENIVVDKSGYLFPFRPFFSPKNLPEIYMGLGPFAEESDDPKKPIAQWNEPMGGRYIELSLTLLALLNEPKIQELFVVKRIDVSKAFSESYGTREVILLIEDLITVYTNGEETQCIFPKILRLSTKNYASELGNYLKLREQIVEQQRASIKLLPDERGVVHRKQTIIDLRIPSLAFIDKP